MYKVKIFFAARKCKKMWKKSFYPNSKFSLQYRTDYLVRKIKSLMKSLKIEVSIQGYENLGNGPCVLYGNHQDNFDALAILYALSAQTEAKDDFNKIPTFIAKHSLQFHWYTRYPLNCLDTFFLDRNNIKTNLEIMEKFSKFVKENKTYGVIFPEGTRNREGTIGEFKPGSFKIPKKELLPIIPFTINNSVGSFSSERKDVLKVEVIFHKRIPASSFATQNTIALSDRVKKIVESSFTPPKYKYEENQKEVNIEESKAAKKWYKKQVSQERKKAKKERKEREQERKIIESQAKEDQKYEKKLDKKQTKTKNK